MSTAKTEIETLILRFRDLVTPSGGTIRHHQELCEDEKLGYVWWGWWHKADETVPDEVFRELDEKARSRKGLTLFLVDSDAHDLWQAVCAEITWHHRHDILPSPEPAATPEYYRDRACLAWFKLSRISRAREGDLHKYAYAPVDDFFREDRSRYAPFYDKQISSIRELMQQNRTIWFIRKARKSDLRHEISFFDAHRVAPEDFPSEVRQSGSLHLLWVSDLHYSVDGHHGFPIEPAVDKWPVGPRIQQSLENHGIRDLAGVLVSGDLTWKADPREYRQAHAFFEWVRRWSGLDSYAGLVCPGNHDVAYSKDPASKWAPVTVAPAEARTAYAHFYQELFYKQPNEFLSAGRRFLLGHALPVEVVALNSSLLEQKKDFFQGHGFLGDTQLEDAAKRMGWNGERDRPRAFRVAMLHHHVLPVTFREEPTQGAIYSVVLDAEALARWVVRHRVDLVLHGHMHQPFCARVARPCDPRNPAGPWHVFHVLGLGSTGVEKEHLGEIGKNAFALLTFRRGGLEIALHTIDAVNPSQLYQRFTLPYSHLGEEA